MSETISIPRFTIETCVCICFSRFNVVNIFFCTTKLVIFIQDEFLFLLTPLPLLLLPVCSTNEYSNYNYSKLINRSSTHEMEQRTVPRSHSCRILNCLFTCSRTFWVHSFTSCTRNSHNYNSNKLKNAQLPPIGKSIKLHFLYISFCLVIKE